MAPLAIGAIAGGTIIAGFSIYRSMSPVNMSDALDFFSSCWSCQLFSDIMSAMSDLLPRVYSALGTVIIPFAAILTAVWFAWKLLSGFMNSKIEEPWTLAETFTTHLVKFAFIIALLAAPLPRLVGDLVVTPVFSVGLSLGRAVSGNDEFAKCIVATAVADPASINDRAASRGAYSPSMRHNLTCEVANVHQMTGLGMTIGWTMMNMSFNDEYMHKILWGVPIFPNVPIFFAGLLILALFFVALLPIPMYFLEIFIKMSMDLIMLPLMFLSWLFKDWPIFPAGGGKSLRGIVDDIVRGAAGIAMTGVFLTFTVMFLNTIFGNWDGASRLALALQENDSQILMDGLMLRNDSVITVVMMGIFIAMFMVMTPALIKTLFNGLSISTSFYDTTKKNINTMWGGVKKWWGMIKK